MVLHLELCFVLFRWKSQYIYICETQQTTLGNAKNDNILGNIDEGYTMQHAILLLSFPCEMEWAREEETDREKNMKKSHLGYITIMLFWLCKSLWNCGNKRKGEKEQNFKYEYEYVYYCTYIIHMIIYTIITHGTTIYQITYAIFGYENHIIRWMFWGQYSIVGIYWKIYGPQCARYRRWRWRCICYIYTLKYLYISAVGATFCGASGMKTQNILSDYKKTAEKSEQFRERSRIRIFRQLYKVLLPIWSHYYVRCLWSRRSSISSYLKQKILCLMTLLSIFTDSCIFSASCNYSLSQ